MIRERKKGEKFFRFEFTEGGKRISGTLNGKKGRPFAATKQEARGHEAQIRIQIRTQLREGTYGKAVGLEDFGGFFDKVFLPYAKEHKASWRHDEFRGDVLKQFFLGKDIYRDHSNADCSVHQYAFEIDDKAKATA